eukprot:TRINITY_DN19347_c0_g1_i1.p1 TRINITY_DN19347_c0_g1~~TRINITY_DN19347_c0_g1_i1.p1  ORF type:complete len:244 (+),score=49.47 TRINITY_DN19347_c0_g1_i1:52-783(+)
MGWLQCCEVVPPQMPDVALDDGLELSGKNLEEEIERCVGGARTCKEASSSNESAARHLCSAEVAQQFCDLRRFLEKHQSDLVEVLCRCPDFQVAAEACEQFTIHQDVNKGVRVQFIDAETSEIAPMLDEVMASLEVHEEQETESRKGGCVEDIAADAELLETLAATCVSATPEQPSTDVSASLSIASSQYVQRDLMQQNQKGLQQMKAQKGTGADGLVYEKTSSKHRGSSRCGYFGARCAFAP